MYDFFGRAVMIGSKVFTQHPKMKKFVMCDVVFVRESDDKILVELTYPHEESLENSATFLVNRGDFISSDNIKKSVLKGTKESEITDWKDLRIGDIVWWCGGCGMDSGEYYVSQMEPSSYSGPYPFEVRAMDSEEYDWVHINSETWKFIRRG